MNDSSQTTCESGDYIAVWADAAGDVAVVSSGATSISTSESNFAGTNRVTTTATLGSFTVNTSTGVIGGVNQLMDLNWSATAASTGTLWISWAGSGFTGNGPFTGTAGPNNSTGGVSVTAFACVVGLTTLGSATTPSTGGTAVPGCVNQAGPPAVQGSAMSATDSSAGVGSISLTTGAGPYATSPFTLEEQLKIQTTSAAGSFTSGDYSLSSVPEPTSVALLGGVLMLTFGAIRRKFQA